MQQPEPKDISLDRIIFFSDAVIAIAITILALEIRIPEGQEDFKRVFPEMVPKILAYVFGFVQIAIFWSAHHALFKKLVGYDGAVIWFNLLFLLVIGFLPVPVSAIIRFGIHSSTLSFMYGSLVLLGIIEWILWRYMANEKRHLLPATVTRAERLKEEHKIIYVVVLFLLGIALSFISPFAAVFVGFSIPFVHRRIERKRLR